MPQLEVVSRSEAEFNTRGKARTEVLSQYIEFIEGLKGNQAGSTGERDHWENLAQCVCLPFPQAINYM